MVNILEEYKKELKRRKDARNFKAQLKNVLLDVEPIETAETLELISHGFNVWDMTMSSIETIEAIHDAITLTQSMRLVEDVSKDVQITSVAVRGMEKFMFALEALGPIVSYIGFWIDLAGAWAAAKAQILTDHAMRGMSTGVVLGANGAGPSYVGSHFWQRAPLSYPMYREAEKPAMNLHNIALSAGYAQGKSLTKNQCRRLFRFLTKRMSAGDRHFYFDANPVTGQESNWENWTPRTKIDFYIALGAVFRKELLK